MSTESHISFTEFDQNRLREYEQAYKRQQDRLIATLRELDAAQREIAGLRSQIACLERQLAESDEATKRAWREAGRAEG